MDDLLRILRENAQESPENMAKMTGLSVEEVRRQIAAYERRGVIRGYQAIIDEDQLDPDRVVAVIEVKVTPEREDGFNQIAKRISYFPEVRSVYLTSGMFDLLLFVDGKDLREVAHFVSARLATLEGVTSTATHFMLKTYKENGVLMEKQDEYERLKVSP